MPEEEVKRRFGLSRIVKLASNENPLGPSPGALRALQGLSGFTGSQLFRYADPHDLRAALAKFHDVEPSRILLGNGSDEITLLMALAYFRPGDNVVTSKPEFIRFKMAAELMGTPCREVPLRADWRHDADGLLAATDSNTRAVYVASPTNPVGTMVPGGDIERMLRALSPSTLFILDQAYHEYACHHADYPNTARLLSEFSNLVVTRTFSKAYGLAGIRLGYGVASPEVVLGVERVRPPFNVSRVAMDAGIAALSGQDHVRASVELNARELPRVSAELEKRGWRVVPSNANFILADCGRSGQPLFDALLRRGVIVRPMGGYGMPHHLRVSIGLPEENDFFLARLDEVLAGQS